MQHLVNPSLNVSARLWFDVRDVPALKEDQKDLAEILQLKSTAMRTLIDAGYDPDSVTTAVDSGDLSTLEHTQLVSVQLQEPGAQPPAPDGPAGNGPNEPVKPQE
jgi:hypothetical protein